LSGARGREARAPTASKQNANHQETKMATTPVRDLGGNTFVAGPNATTIAAANDTYVFGTAVDMSGHGSPQSLIGLVMLGFTTASGAAGAKNTLTLIVESADDSAMSTNLTTEKTITYEFVWAANGANIGHFVTELDSSGFKQYARIKAKLTESGTVTISAQSALVGMVLGGSGVLPVPLKSATDTNTDGDYQHTTEPSA
jgi:hypothetical protein